MKWLSLLMVALTAASLCSCSLLPEEEELRRAPLIETYTAESYTLAFAERGDMTLSIRISLTYVPVKTEVLRFSVGGEYYDEVFASVGDTVKVGDLLAQLKLNGVQEKINQAQIEVSEFQLRLTHLEEDLYLALNHQRIAGQAMNSTDLSKALEDIQADFTRQKQALSDALYIRQMQLNEMIAERDKRQLRAGIDGTITYVRRVKEGDLSVSGDRFISLSDSTVSAFRAETDKWPRFRVGDEYLIAVGKAEYEAVVADEAELGIVPKEKVEGEAANVYLLLKQPQLDLEEGDRGTLTLVLDTRRDVLKLPDKAVTSANGQKVVYYQDEEGMKGLKTVETGLEAQGMVEIISGLSEGESVILQ